MLPPGPAQLSKFVRGLQRASCVTKYGLLLMMDAVLSVVRAAELMHDKAHYLPTGSTGSCDKNAEKGNEEVAIAFSEGYSGAKDRSTRPIDPWTGMYIRRSGL